MAVAVWSPAVAARLPPVFVPKVTRVPVCVDVKLPRIWRDRFAEAVERMALLALPTKSVVADTPKPPAEEDTDVPGVMTKRPAANCVPPPIPILHDGTEPPFGL
jgi:hypothetical protein